MRFTVGHTPHCLSLALLIAHSPQADATSPTRSANLEFLSGAHAGTASQFMASGHPNMTFEIIHVVLGPLVFTVLFCGLLMLWARLQGIEPCVDELDVEGVARNARWVFVIVSFVTSVAFTMIIPDSLDVVEGLGGDATFSGVLIGIFKGAQFFGFLAIWLALRKMPDLWQWHSFSIQAGFTVVMICGSVGSVVAAYVAVKQETPLLWVFLLMRAIQGVGSGALALIATTVVNKITDASQIPLQFTRQNYAAMFGIGLGPFMTSMMHSLHDQYVLPLAGFFSVGPQEYVQTVFQSFALIGLTEVSMLLVMMFVICRFYPTLASTGAGTCSDVDNERTNTSSTESTQTITISEAQRKLLIVACVLFNGCRGYVVSGLEAATAMILEDTFGLEKTRSGFVVGLTFCGGFLIQMLYERKRSTLSDEAWMRAALLLACAVAPLLSPFPCKVIGGRDEEPKSCITLLGTADFVLFPTLFLAGGLAEGLSLKYALGEGLFSAPNIILAQRISIDAIGRSLGPAFARNSLEKFGRGSYALEQQTIVVVSLACMEFAVGRVLRVSPATQHSQHSQHSYEKSPIKVMPEVGDFQAGDTDTRSALLSEFRVDVNERKVEGNSDGNSYEDSSLIEDLNSQTNPC